MESPCHLLLCSDPCVENVNPNGKEDGERRPGEGSWLKVPTNDGSVHPERCRPLRAALPSVGDKGHPATICTEETALHAPLLLHSLARRERGAAGHGGAWKLKGLLLALTLRS